MVGGARPTFRILVIDDCDAAVGGLASLLVSWGHEVRTAHDGPTALTVGAAYQPDVVLLELSIPKMGGCEVARLLRAQAGAGSLLLVALSADSGVRHRHLSEEAGFDFLLLTPIEPKALRRVLQTRGGRAGKATRREGG